MSSEEEAEVPKIPITLQIEEEAINNKNSTIIEGMEKKASTIHSLMVMMGIL